MTFAERIRALRKKKGWTVYDLAKEIPDGKGIPKTPGYISKIEARGEIPSPEMIVKLAAALGVKPEELAEIAKAEKSAELVKNVNRKYDDAVALYRKSSKK